MGELESALHDKAHFADRITTMEAEEQVRLNEKVVGERGKIRKLEHQYDTLRASLSPSRDGGSGRLEGAKVEGNYRGRGRWYPCRISRERADGTFDIDYD